MLVLRNNQLRGGRWACGVTTLQVCYGLCFSTMGKTFACEVEMNTGTCNCPSSEEPKMGICALNLHIKIALVDWHNCTSKTNLLRFTKILKLEIAVTVISWIFTSVNFYQKLGSILCSPNGKDEQTTPYLWTVRVVLQHPNWTQQTLTDGP